MQAVWARGVQHEMKTLRHGANPLQGAAQKRGEIGPQSGFDNPVRSKEAS